MPKTVQEYDEKSKDVKTETVNIPEFKQPHNDKIANFPVPPMLLTKYNFPAGSRSVDLRYLRQEGHQLAQGVATPCGDKLAYSEIYYDKVNEKVTSEIYIIKNTEGYSLFKFLKAANVAKREYEPIIASGIPVSVFGQQNVILPLDWSKNGDLLAVKETIGNSRDGIWKTNLIVYDFNKSYAKELFELRQAIISYWQEQKGLNLNDYMWDIHPLGWSQEYPNRLVVAAFVEKKHRNPFFLGEWSIDYTGENPILLSKKEITSKIQSNGFTLKFGEKY